MIPLIATLRPSFHFSKLFFRSPKRSQMEAKCLVEEPLLEDDEMVPVRAEVVQVIDDCDGADDDDDDGEEEEEEIMVVRRPHSENLWCQLPETVESGIVSRLSKEQIAVQEAIYEVIRTEESYLKRLVILQEHFADGLKMMLAPRDWKELFEFVKPVLEVSHRFLEDLLAERRRSQGPYLPVSNFCRVVRRHAECDFDAYVRYCCNQIYQQRCLKQLKNMYPVLDVDLKRLESTARCGDTNRTLESYLMLPVQRITILPLLIDAVGKNVDVGSDEREACFRVGNRIRQIVSSCNERTREIQLREEMLIAGNQLEFDDVPSIGLVTHRRWLVKKGPVKRQLESRISYVDTYHRTSKLKILHKQVWIFLFIDLIIIARRRKHVEDERYKVLSYCQRNMAVIFDSSNKIPEMVPDEFDCKGFQLCLLQNHENIEEEMILLCEDEDTRNSWVELLSSKSRLHAVYPKMYQEWDCPQMRVITVFEAEQPKDLPLNVGELVDVREKRSDGWCYGVKSGNVKAEGWFPRDHVEKVASVYERAKIMRRNYQRRRRKILDNKENSWKKLATFYMDE